MRKAQGNTPVVANMEGVLKIAQRDYEGARQAFNRAIGMKADFMPARANLGRLELILNRIPEAEKIFRKWELDFAVIGEVTDTGRMQLVWNGETV